MRLMKNVRLTLASLSVILNSQRILRLVAVYSDIIFKELIHNISSFSFSKLSLSYT